MGWGWGWGWGGGGCGGKYERSTEVNTRKDFFCYRYIGVLYILFFCIPTGRGVSGGIIVLSFIILCSGFIDRHY